MPFSAATEIIKSNSDTSIATDIKLLSFIFKMKKVGPIFSLGILILFLNISSIAASPVAQTTTVPDDAETTTGYEGIIFREEDTASPNVTAVIPADKSKPTPLPTGEVKDPLKDVIVVFRQEGPPVGEEEEDEESEEEEEGEIVVATVPASSTTPAPFSTSASPALIPEQELELPINSHAAPERPQFRPKPSRKPNPAAAEESNLENAPGAASPSEGDEGLEGPEEPPPPPPRPSIQPVQEGILPVQEPGGTRRPKPTLPSTQPPPPTPSLPMSTLEVDSVPGIPIEENPGAFVKESAPTSAPVKRDPIAVLPPPSGKYKITKPKPSAAVAAPQKTTNPPQSISEEWNLTSSVFTLSPQGRAACECGKTPFRLDNTQGLNEYPWAVAIVRAGIFGGGRPHCGGVLINDRYVLSSASCFESIYADGIQVWLTAHNSLSAIDNVVHSDRVIKRDVREILMHPNYERRSHDNDIALVKLSHPVDISTSSYYVPACLPAGLATYDGMTGRVMGWGSTAIGPNRYSPNKMCKEDIPVISNSVCNRDTSHRNKVTANQMCAGFLTKVATETCIGDAGGPLMLPNNGRFTLIGLVSFGFTNRQAYTPVVYTRVSNYADFILHNTEDADWCSL